ncbi:cation transport protein-domain-containing protein [Bisporella sp. PMI_857]|nr:cation transport protein-domain-containing protein [Bisporella sp. PMI_857]
MTEAGLNTVNLSQITTFQQVLLWILILIGSTIFVSISTVVTRKRVFENRLRHVVELQKEARRMRKRSMSFVQNTGSRRAINGIEKREGPVPDTNAELNSVSHDLPVATVPDPTEMPEEQPPAASEAAKENGSGSPVAKQTLEVLEESGTRADEDTNKNTEEKLESHDIGIDANHLSFVRYRPSPALSQRRFLTFAGVGAHPSATGYKSPYPNSIYSRATRKEPDNTGDEEVLSYAEYPNYLTRSTTGRNAQFFGLTKEQREHLGGVEYRAITLLSLIVPLYFFLWQFLGCLGLAAYIAHNKAKTAEDNGINPWWLGIFNGVSAFNNSGMSLLDLNMIPFQTSAYALITMGILILAGNTAYPLFLRSVFWSMYKVLNLAYPSADQYTDHKATLRFILEYPRRVYTNLFPARQTWWLLLMLIVLNSIDWVAFELLNIGNSNTASIPKGFRVLDGLFQALAVRSGGFYIIPIPYLRIGLQFLYVIMMYISVYPVVITMRHSNVYEERSLGIYADDEEATEELPPKLGTLKNKLRRTITSTISGPFMSASGNYQQNTRRQFVQQQIRGQLAHDLWWLAIAVFAISCIEVSNFERDPVTYSVFNIIFEVVSAYGCVGISPGLPDQAYSFSGGWHVASKLVLCAVMLRGRHRGLPVALDRAVRLPGHDAGFIEEEDQLVRQRTISANVTPHTLYDARLSMAENRSKTTSHMKGLGLRQV